jgi:hypothetical protein
MIGVLVASAVLIIAVLMAYAGLLFARRAVAAGPVRPSQAVSPPHPPSLQRLAAQLPSAEASTPGGACIEDLSREEAEDLLDWLEATGRGTAKVTYNGQRFTVMWKS